MGGGGGVGGVEGHEFVYDFLDAGAGFFLIDFDGAADGDGLGIDEPAGALIGDVVDEAGGGVDVHGGADNDEVIAALAEFGGGLDVGDGFAEPDDVRAELGAVGGEVADEDVVVADVDDEVGVAFAAGHGELAVEVKDVGGAGALVEVVDILGDDVDVVFFFEPN